MLKHTSSGATQGLHSNNSRHGSGFETSLECVQPWSGYTDQEHATWSRLMRRQIKLLPARACNEFTHGLARLDLDDQIPNFERMSRRIRMTTGWELLPVSGQPQFSTRLGLLADRRLPVQIQMRGPEELDRPEQGDLFSDFFGAAPMLCNPVFAELLQTFAKHAQKHDPALMQRLHAYLFDSGLVATADGLRIFGARILASAQEVQGVLSSPRAQRIDFDLLRVLRTEQPDGGKPQLSYFVVDSFVDLLDQLSSDLTPSCSQARLQPVLQANTLLAREHCHAPVQAH